MACEDLPDVTNARFHVIDDRFPTTELEEDVETREERVRCDDGRHRCRRVDAREEVAGGFYYLLAMNHGMFFRHGARRTSLFASSDSRRARGERMKGTVCVRV
jgi:hypothetical protein